MDEIYDKKEINISQLEESEGARISEKEKFQAAKQILLGIAFLYVFTILVFIFKPSQGDKLIDICTTTFPPLATLILCAYFRDKN